MIPLLAIDANLRAGFSAAWRLHGMDPVYVYSVSEAIEMLAEQEFILVAVNEDNLACLPNLQLLRDATTAPILVFTDYYTVQREIEAIRSGADAYSQWRTCMEDNVLFALALLHRYGERSVRRRKAPKALSCRGILLAQGEHCKAFVHGTELKLTHMEFSILYQLLLNRGRILPYAQLYESLHRAPYMKADAGKMFSTVKRLREKLSVHIDVDSYIENVRGIGYRMIH